MEDRRHFNACVGPNQAYYAKVFQALHQGQGIQLNWAAGVFGLFWFWYRKVFLWSTLLFLAIMVVASYVGANWVQAMLAAHFASWVLGNNIYYFHVNHMIERHVRHHGAEQSIPVLAARGPVAGPLETVAVAMCAAGLLGLGWLVMRAYAA